MSTSKNFLSALLSFFLPPVAVFLQVGFGIHFWINLVLVLLFYFPGQIHAFWVIASTGQDGKDDPEAMSKFIALLLAAFLPPVSVLIRKGFGVALLVNLLLCVFFWLPAILHALWVAGEED